MAVYKVGSARKPTGEIASFVGEAGDLFYSTDDSRLRISDGTTPGGILLATGGGGDSFDISTVSTTDLAEGVNQYYTLSRAYTAFDARIGGTSAIASVRSYVNASGDLAYNQSTGTFSINLPDAGIANIVEDTTPQLGGDLATNGNDVLFADNDKLKIGTGGDLEIFHNQTASWIKDTGSGYLNITGEIALRKSDLSVVADFGVAGTGLNSARLHFSGSGVKLATTSVGIDITGTLNTHTIPGGTGTLALTSDIPAGFDGVFASLTSKPTTISGYGITDAIENLADLGVNSTATELNYLDGTTGITLANAGDLLIVGSDGTSINSSDLLNIDISNGRLGIGTSSPVRTLHLVGDVAYEGSMRIDQYHNSIDGPDVLLHKARGTPASPLANQAGDEIGKFNFVTHDGSGFVGRAKIQSIATVDGAQHGANLEFLTGKNAASSVRMTIDELGDTTFTGDITTTGDIQATDLIATGTVNLDRLALTSSQTTVPPLQLTASALNDNVGALRIDSVEPDIYLNDTNGGFATVTFANADVPRVAFGRDSSDDFYLTVRDPATNSGLWRNDTFVCDSSTGNVSYGYNLSATGSITPGVYANTTARDAALSSPTNGMMIYLTATHKFQGYANGAWTDLN